jgi:hypothetical protein
MPTGYTEAISKGITFEKFALSCARAFGALVTMRDEPADAPIPEEFKPSDYSEKQLALATDRVDELKAMKDAECARLAKADYEKQVQYHKEGISKDAALKAKYEAMLAEVEAWTPPSPDHEGLKKFMRDQIAESIRFDCGGNYHQDALKELRPLTGKEWRQSELNKALEQISYHSESQREENARTAARNKWVRQLKESLQ